MKHFTQLPVRPAIAVAFATASLLLASTGCDPDDPEEPDPQEFPELADAPEVAQQPLPGEPAPLPDEGDPDDVMVAVDGEVLTRGEMNERLQQAMAAQDLRQVPPEMMEQVSQQFRDRILEGFVAQQVLMNEVQRREIEADEAKVEETMEEIRGGLPEGVSLEMALLGEGMSEDDLRENIRGQLRLQDLVDQRMEETGVTEPTDDEVKTFYDESPQHFEMPETVEARHILVDNAEKAEEVRKKIVEEGADFAEMAREHSDCPSGQRGGELGQFPRGQMVPEFDQAAFEQEVGVTGPVVQTDFGYHIIKVTDRREARTEPLEEVEESIAEHLMQRKRQEVVEKYVEELKEAATIRYGQ